MKPSIEAKNRADIQAHREQEGERCPSIHLVLLRKQSHKNEC